jgi:hypothetical protein
MKKGVFMKKYLILTSVLSLAACGGGGSGGSVAPGPVYTQARKAAAESNANVTGMNSFIIIGGKNPTVNSNARAASNHVFSESGGGKVVDLENVTFKTIPTSGVISDLMFHTDKNGKIESIEFLDAKKIMAEHKGSSVFVGEIERKGDTNKFIAHRGQLPNMEQTGDMQIEYVSYAKEAGQGLKYSDFGMLRIDTSVLVGADDDTYNMPFMGGFDEKNITNTQMKDLAKNGDIVFTGLAKGTVAYSNQATHESVSDSLEDNAATLTFAKNGTQTLAADFTNWAKIEAVKAANGKNQFKVVESYVPDTSKLYVETSPAGLVDGAMKENAMAFRTGYYGDNNAPNEGVGLVQYQKMEGYNDSIKDYEHHVNVDLGFGGTKH